MVVRKIEVDFSQFASNPFTVPVWVQRTIGRTYVTGFKADQEA